MNDPLKMLEDLRRPFHPSVIEWKPGMIKGERAMAMPYADLRSYMNRLDEVCGLDWSVAYEPWGADRIICKLTIGGVTRASTGEMGAQDEKNEMGGTVAEAQAMKRACAMFGLGRYLYSLPTGWADIDPQSKRFTDKAKAKLVGIVMQHYRRATGGDGTSQNAPTTAQTAQDSTQDTSTPVSVVEDATPYFVRDWQRLTGREYDLVKWVATLHDKSDGACTPKQYQYLTSIVDKLTSSQHNYVLSLLCQSEISGDNMPGRKVATELIKILPEQMRLKDDDGKEVRMVDGKFALTANPNYRRDICEMITAMAQQVYRQQPA